MLTNTAVLALAKQIDLATTPEDIVDANFDALYEYFTTPDGTNKNLMPYGTAKARTGDPYQWIAEELEAALWAKNIATQLSPTDLWSFYNPMDMSFPDRGTRTEQETYLSSLRKAQSK